jgi:hypothetical protein
VDLQNSKYPVGEKLARALLATTCLTGAAGMASASTIIEGQAPAPADFANSFALATLLPPGTTIVMGSVTGGDLEDFFQFSPLIAGDPYTVTATFFGFTEEGLRVSLFDSSQNNLNFGSLEGAGASLSGTVPGDGTLIVEMIKVSGFGNPGQYSVTFTDNAPDTPEPATLPEAGLALAGALAWSRRRTLKS